MRSPFYSFNPQVFIHFCLAGCFEGFPIAIVEAMLHGKPVICSRIGGLPEIIEDNKTGLLFEPGNTKDLADKINFLWQKPDLCKKMGKAGQIKAQPGQLPRPLLAAGQILPGADPW